MVAGALQSIGPARAALKFGLRRGGEQRTPWTPTVGQLDAARGQLNRLPMHEGGRDEE